MVARMKILDEFRELSKYYSKKYKKQAAFRSLRMVTNESGTKEPVFYIGVPGLMVALTITFVTVVTIYLLYLPFKWYVWIPYIISLFFMFRVALKLDKVRQIRHMVSYMLESSIKVLEKAQSTEDSSEKEQFVRKAEEWLEKADKWVDEPELKAQLELVRNSH